jgi:SAM-dependent methyltransferase
MQAGSRTTTDPIDAVYLWVDGASEHTQRRMAAALARAPDQRPDAVAAERFRNHDELRYSLRSLDQYAPWIRRVHLVTDGSWPAWLRLDHPRLSLVSHEQIFSNPMALPSFNSDAIGLQLHRIPGLSRHFVVFNDDLFLGQPVALSDFRLDDGSLVVYLDSYPPPRHPLRDTVSHSLAYTRRVIEERLGTDAVVGVSAHTPQIFDRDLLAVLERSWEEDFRRTSASTFRSQTDLVLRLLYACAAVAGVADFPAAVPRVLRSGSPEYSFLQLEPEPEQALSGLLYLISARPRFFCINDDLGAGPVSEALGRFLRWALEQLYPQASSFELASGPDAPVAAPSSAAGAEMDSAAAVHWNLRLTTHWSSAGVGSLECGVPFNTWRNRVRVRVFRRAVRRLAVDLPDARVLDVGTGTGLYLREWKRLGAGHIAGVDIADAAIRRLRAEHPDVELVQADVGGDRLPFPPGSFDAVSAFAVLFHVVDSDRYGAAIQNLSDVLTPGGYLLMSDSPLAAERCEGSYWVARSERVVRSALADAGLEVIATGPESVLLSPPQRLGEPWTTGWDRMMRLARGREWLGWCAGALAFPFELGLTRALRRGPSTDLFVCRKLGERSAVDAG